MEIQTTMEKQANVSEEAFMADMQIITRAIEELSGGQLRKAMLFLTEMNHIYRKDLLEEKDRYRGRDQQRRFSRWMKREDFPVELRDTLITIGRAIYYSNSD